MKRSVALFFLSCTFFLSNAQELSESCRISLITLSPGEELYSVFGHSAIRVFDPERNIDDSYNYGTFDFKTPNFYMKFTRGKLDYMLSKHPFYYTVAEAQHDNRSLYEQQWNLTYEEKLKVYRFLENNLQPENRFYKYDFFYDNCATRIRDVMELSFPSKYHGGTDYLTESMTFRNMIDIYLVKSPWSDFGIDICLGMPADRWVDDRTATFLPDFLKLYIDGASISKGDSTISLVKSTTTLFKEMPTDSGSKFNWKAPMVVMWAIFIVSLLITIWEIYSRSRARVFDLTLFSVVGLIGWLIVFLWFFTDHQTTKGNLNIVWAIPIFFPLSFWLFKKHVSKSLSKVMFIYAIVIIVFLLGWSFWPQNLHNALIPVCLALALRAFVISRYKLK